MRGAQTRLRLQSAGDSEVAARRPDPSPVPLQATDPRWVLALRTQEQLQGPILSPNRRDKLIRLGRTMGLGPFESNLVIAIVQDQARRGRSLHDAEPTLRFVPTHRRMLQPHRRTWRIALVSAVFLAAEALLVMWWL